jgi:putative endonuclease
MKEQGHWFVYMLECENGSYYTGSTDDIVRRFDEHLRGTAKAKYTRSFRPVRIARCWRLAGTRGDAQKVERAIQRLSRKGKEDLVADPVLLGSMLSAGMGEGLDIALHDCTRNGPARGDITVYRAATGDTEGNPYLEEVLALVRTGRRSGRAALMKMLGEKRGELVCRYAFSIPTPDLLREIASRSPLVEIGAGSGYWARCLTASGADIVAYDARPPAEGDPCDATAGNRWFEDEWFNVMEGDASMAGRYPERTLFLCWPPIHDAMAMDALAGYRAAGGKTLIYIGDPGSSGDEAFHRELGLLKTEYSAGLWSWPGVEERLMIFSL